MASLLSIPLSMFECVNSISSSDTSGGGIPGGGKSGVGKSEGGGSGTGGSSSNTGSFGNDSGFVRPPIIKRNRINYLL